MENLDNSISSHFPKPRQEIENMNPYIAPLEGRRNLLRLDFNENTIGPSPKVIDAIRSISSKEIATYPEYNGLQQAAANSLNSLNKTHLEPSQIGLFNGVDSAIHAIFHSYGNAKEKFLTTLPTFGYYNPCANMQGMQIIEIPYEARNFSFPLNAIKDSLKKDKPRLLMICNPNNPTGTKTSAKNILELAFLSPRTLIIVDELYEAFLGDSILPIIDFSQTPNIVVLRSLSKISGLAGLRIGFGIGNKEVINRIKRVTGPYDINSFAVKAAFAALKDQEYIDNYVRQVLDARKWIHEKLLTYEIKHHIDSGNYFLIWPKKDSSEIESSLKANGILIRNMKNKPLIEGSLRVSIGTKSQMETFWRAFQKAEGI